MSHPIYEQYGKPQNNMVQQFEQFRKTFSGNPQQIIQNMLNSGRITQDQLNKAVQMANQYAKMMK